MRNNKKSTALFFVNSLAVLIACFGALLHCSPELAPGGGTDFPNTKTLSGVVLTSSGAPAAGARVLVIDKNHWLGRILAAAPVAVDSTATDGAGRFSVTYPEIAGWNLQIDGAGEATLLQDGGMSGDSTLTVRLKPCGALNGTATADTGSCRSLFLYGSAYAATVRGGVFAFPALAEGEYAVISDAALSGRSLATCCRVASAQSVSGVSIIAPVNRVVVDDFSAGNAQTNLGRILGDGWWYSVSDQTAGGSSTAAFEVVAGGRMQATFTLGTAVAGPWAMVGFFIGKADGVHRYDLSSLQSFSFMAKGSGTIEVRFVSKTLDTLAGNGGVQFSSVISLPGAWSRIAIPVDSLRLPASSVAAKKGYTWIQAATAVQEICFVAKYPDNKPGDTVSLLIDDCSLDGIRLEELNR
jgi:hypothetical protein